MGLEEEQEIEGRERREISYGQKSQNVSASSAETDLTCNQGCASKPHGALSSAIDTQTPF